MLFLRASRDRGLHRLGETEEKECEVWPQLTDWPLGTNVVLSWLLTQFEFWVENYILDLSVYIVFYTCTSKSCYIQVPRSQKMSGWHHIGKVWVPGTGVSSMEVWSVKSWHIFIKPFNQDKLWVLHSFLTTMTAEKPGYQCHGQLFSPLICSKFALADRTFMYRVSKRNAIQEKERN